MASIHSTGKLYRIGDAASFLGVSVACLRDWERKGLIDSVKSPRGSRYFSEETLRNYLGLDSIDLSRKEKPRICCVCRVSTSAQNSVRGSSDKSDLDRQKERVEKYVKERWGSKSEIEWNISVRSGLAFNHDSFTKLCQNTLEGKYDYIICTTRERIMRMSYEIFSMMAEIGGAEIIEVNGEEGEVDYTSEMAQDLLAITHVYSCRHYSRRGAKANTKHLTNNCVNRILELNRQHKSVKQMAAKLKQEGFYMESENSGREPVSVNKIYQVLRNQEALDAVDAVVKGNKKIPTEQFGRFIDDCVELTENKKDRIKQGELYQYYCNWTDEPVDVSTFGHLVLDRLGERRKRINGTRFLAGLKLKK